MWLCKHKGDEIIRSDYGLLEDEVGMDFTNPDKITGGITVLCVGDMRKWTQFSYVCDWTLNVSDLKLSQSVDIKEYELQFVIGSRGTCADSFRPPVQGKAVLGLAIVVMAVVLCGAVELFVYSEQLESRQYQTRHSGHRAVILSQLPSPGIATVVRPPLKNSK
jgi:hypothetical protein